MKVINVNLEKKVNKDKSSAAESVRKMSNSGLTNILILLG